MQEEANQAIQSRPTRWYLGIGVGLLLGVPFGWLLSYLAFLLALLGLFFFIFAGLIIGATVYRFAEPARPISRARLRSGAVVVVTFTWAVSFVAEAHDFPQETAGKVLRTMRVLPPNVTADSFLVDTSAWIKTTMARDYPPGGMVGYVHWVLASSRLEIPVPGSSRPHKYTLPQPRWWWLVRVVLSFALLTFGVYSQISGLAKPRDAERTAEPPAQIREGTAAVPVEG